MEKLDRRSKEYKTLSQEEKDNHDNLFPIKKVNNNNNNHGGLRTGAGRKTLEEKELLEMKLDDVINSDVAVHILNNLIMSGDFRALKLYFEYRFGRPKERIDVTSGGEKINTPMISFFSTDDED